MLPTSILKLVTLLLLLLTGSNLSAKTITAFTEVFPPFQYYDDQGKLTGISIELIKEAGLLVGAKTDVKVYPWARSLSLAESNDEAMIFTISQTKERLSQFDWFYLFDIDNTPYVWTLKDKRFASELSWPQLLKLNTAIPRADTQYDFLVQKGFSKENNLFVTNNFRQAINMLIAGRVDFVFAGQVSMMTQMKNANIDLNLIAANPIDARASVKVGFAFNKNADPENLEMYRAAFNTLSKNGKLQAILEQYMYISD